MFTGDGGLTEVIKLNPWWWWFSSSSGGDGDILYVVGSILLVVFVLVYSLISFFNYKKKKLLKITTADSAVDDESTANDDAKYAEELQIQEALFASMLHKPKSSSSSLGSLLLNDTQLCNICLENHEPWKMYTNSTCRHSFCYECTTKHATTKIQEKNNPIPCPEFNCKSFFDPNALRPIIPRHTMIKWDTLLCESTILESHKLYCPFATCSALLIHDDVTVTKIDCPVCGRSICAVCKVPWHSDFTCKEFGKLTGKKHDLDKMAEALAKKKKWKKCRKCKFFVEKSEGCLHITCRCKYEFCYNCGSKWTSNHGGCRPKSRFLPG